MTIWSCGLSNGDLNPGGLWAQEPLLLDPGPYTLPGIDRSVVKILGDGQHHEGVASATTEKVSYPRLTGNNVQC